MPALMRRLNYRHIILGEDTQHESVGVRLKDGTWRYLPWLGFLDVDTAAARGRPVKLEVIRVTDGDGLGDWERLEAGQFAQGCLVGHGVFGVLVDGSPRIIGI